MAKWHSTKADGVIDAAVVAFLLVNGLNNRFKLQAWSKGVGDF